MKPTDTGHLYDGIGTWWNEHERDLTSGIHFVHRARETVTVAAIVHGKRLLELEWYSRGAQAALAANSIGDQTRAKDL